MTELIRTQKALSEVFDKTASIQNSLRTLKQRLQTVQAKTKGRTGFGSDLAMESAALSEIERRISICMYVIERHLAEHFLHTTELPLSTSADPVSGDVAEKVYRHINHLGVKTTVLDSVMMELEDLSENSPRPRSREIDQMLFDMYPISDKAS